jgi:NitT/TauT family transport system permease protein
MSVSTAGIGRTGVQADAAAAAAAAAAIATADTPPHNRVAQLQPPITRSASSRRRAFLGRSAPVLLPILLAVLVLSLWQLACTLTQVPKFLVPSPIDVAQAAVSQFGLLSSAFLVTATEALIAFVSSVVIGVLGALLLSSHRIVELSAYPYAILLQTIPSVATAPLIIIWFGVTPLSVVIIATIMAFIPVLSNTLIGLRSADQRFSELFLLLSASRWQTLVRLRMPAALPYLVGGLRISSTLVVIGVIVAEYISGIGSGRAGLGFLITKSAIRLETPLLFAAGLTCALLGILFYALVQWIGRLLLSSWHESELTRDS